MALHRCSSGSPRGHWAEVHQFHPAVPHCEVNWFQCNQSAKFLSQIDPEDGGLINLGTSGMTGHSIVTSTVGAKFALTESIELGLGYQFAMQREKSLYGDSLIAQVIWRY